ncbi:MAG: hypothetical protein K5829_05810 [Treponema sp.]|nr:hypothetical protein [Treponema sp.]
MKRAILSIFLFVFLTQVFAYNRKNTSVEQMYLEVSESLDHEIEKYEQNIIDTTYLYYYKQCNGKWNKTVWDEAVSKSIDFCNDKAAVTASKAGDFGEKFLQALIVTSEDIWHGFNNWLDKKSREYNKRK